MKNKLFKAITALVFAGLSINANATLITLNGSTEVNALELNESFESFYDFTNWSANTGFEKANELVAFFATDNNNSLGLYMIFGGPGGQAGNIKFDINSNTGSVVFVDDPGNRDPVVTTTSGTNVTFGYIAGKTDGLVYSNFTDGLWILDIVFDTFSGINGYSFLTFDDNGQSSIALSGNGLEDISISSLPSSNVIAANGPSAFILMLVACLMLVRRRV